MRRIFALQMQIAGIIARRGVYHIQASPRALHRRGGKPEK